MSTNVYRYESDAVLMKTYRRYMKRADRELRHGYPHRAQNLYDAAQAIANEMDRRKS